MVFGVKINQTSPVGSEKYKSNANILKTHLWQYDKTEHVLYSPMTDLSVPFLYPMDMHTFILPKHHLVFTEGTSHMLQI